MAKNEPTGLLHIYGQGAWHEDAFIVGNVEALVALRNALNEVIEAHGKGYSTLPDGAIEKEDCDFWASDGEGYPLHVILLNGEWKTETWGKLMTPYYEKIAQDKNREIIKPWEL